MGTGGWLLEEQTQFVFYYWPMDVRRRMAIKKNHLIGQVLLIRTASLKKGKTTKNAIVSLFSNLQVNVKQTIIGKLVPIRLTIHSTP